MNLIAHVEIPVRDLERAMRFYSAVFVPRQCAVNSQ